MAGTDTNARSKRNLVLGGAGFLGSHLCERLVADGEHVICLDDLSTGSRANIAHLEASERFELLVHDVMTPFDVPADRIWNLACPASPPIYQADPIRTMLVNVQGTLNGLRLAVKQKARFFQASTSEIYGDPDVHPQPESYLGAVNSVGVRACYDEGKRAAETMVMDMHRTTGVDVRLARFFNTYGPRMAPDDGRVVSNFLVQALRGQDITIYGDGSQTRSFCYVDDLIEGAVRYMNHPSEIGPLNLGNPNEFSMSSLAEHVIRLTESKSRLVRLPLPPDDPKLRCPVITRAQQLLDFNPQIPLVDGLTKTMHYFRDLLAKTQAAQNAKA